MAARTFHEFDSLDEAKRFRREHGNGGWIFADERGAILFPPSMTPTPIMLHPLLIGRSGQLYP